MSHHHTKPRLAAALTVAALCLSSSDGMAAGERIVAIGDIHGAYEEFVEILKAADLIDDDLNWSGGNSRLVQTGDFTDRGSGVRDTMDLLRRIERQAPEQGGEAHILLGNHEAMNLIYDDRDARVNPDIVVSFADAQSEARRQAAYEEFDTWRQRRKQTQEKLLGGREDVKSGPELVAFINQSREAWLESHPLGLLEYREAMSVRGSYGSWLLERPVAVKLDDTLFLHGGIAAASKGQTLDRINRLHRRRLKDFAAERMKLKRRGVLLTNFSWNETRLALEHQLRFPSSTGSREMAIEGWEMMNELIADLFANESPLWFRGYAHKPLGLEDEPLAALLDQTDSAYGVRRTVAAHSPIGDHSILSRLDGRVFLIDTGMLSSFYGGRASALEISSAGVAEIYAESPLEGASVGSNGDEPSEGASLGSRDRGAYRGASRGGVVLANLAAGADQETSATGPFRPTVFYGPDGEPLPFQEQDEIERFLREAVLGSMEPVGQGKTGAEKVELELDGARARAIFHSIDDKRGSPTKPVTLDDGSKVMYFLDSYRGQVAVYELSKILGMTNVPPAVKREVDGRAGSLALWIENGTNLFDFRESGKGDPKDPRAYLQMHDMRFFDALVNNTDRNSQNIFWTGKFDLWFIDHTRTMSQERKINRPDRVRRCSRPLLESIKGLDEAEVRRALKPYVSSFEVKALFNRRKKLLDLIDERIKENGEEHVVFDYDQKTDVSSKPEPSAVDS